LRRASTFAEFLPRHTAHAVDIGNLVPLLDRGYVGFFGYGRVFPGWLVGRLTFPGLCVSLCNLGRGGICIPFRRCFGFSGLIASFGLILLVPGHAHLPVSHLVVAINCTTPVATLVPTRSRGRVHTLRMFMSWEPRRNHQPQTK